MARLPPVRYSIAPLSAHGHLYEVHCTVADPDPGGQRFALPAWIPGSYLVRDFARHVVAIDAASGGRPVALEKRDKHTWRADPVRGPLTVRVEVYAFDLSVRGAHLDTSHGFFNGACVFLRVLGREDRRCEIRILAPKGAAAKRGRYRNWRVATSMRSNGAARSEFGAYDAADYDELIDHPVEMGEFALLRFRARGVPHEVALSGAHRVDAARLARDMKRVCEQHIDFWRGNVSRSAAGGRAAPFGRYLFLVTAVGKGYGGLEHRASTALLCARDDLPQPGMKTPTEGYRGFLGLCSHEYFHAWNIKRIKPSAFVPYDLERENYTRLLWLFEGFTSYYDDLALVRCGVITPKAYLELLGRTITAHLRTPGRARQTLADSSFDAWTKYYRPDENTPNAVVSYYLKGSLVALCLDLLIRERTRGRRSLDDVMRALWRRYGMRGRGVGEGDFERLADEVTGLRLASFFNSALRSTRELPLEPRLRAHGVQMDMRAAESSADRGGGPPGRGSRSAAARASLGVQARSEGSEIVITHVLDDGAAMKAGLAAGDAIVAVDGVRPGAGGLDGLLERRKPGEDVLVHLFRRDELLALRVQMGRSPRDTCRLSFQGRRGKALRQRWLYRSVAA
ncbi:MAG: peptidase M61 [Betaproteobacteria bacterium RIFCSPLOWO2_02_FULL_63_19]|nr:MAG: peptidase M61 [Betaproteobacteria bacterium RIFCSPLOWO2_02_FULL_63_19]